jgi:hypothetical protein
MPQNGQLIRLKQLPARRAVCAPTDTGRSSRRGL